jgi:hypothetical protein
MTRAANTKISIAMARSGLRRPSACRTPRGTPPATVEPLGSHGRCESATTQASNDGDVGEFADSERARTTAAREAGHHERSGVTPHVQCANPHTECAPGRLLCALGPPWGAHVRAWRAPCSAQSSRPAMPEEVTPMTQTRGASTEPPGRSTDAPAQGRPHADPVHQRPGKETTMSKLLQRGTAIVAVIASLAFATAALAQMPTSPWKKAAPFQNRMKSSTASPSTESCT